MRVKMLHPCELTLFKGGSEYPAIFKAGDIVNVDPATKKYLQGINYVRTYPRKHRKAAIMQAAQRDASLKKAGEQ